jgi:hypothetical protein
MTIIASPGEGWFLMCRQRISADKIYGAGCRVEAEKLGRNLAALLRVGAVAWMPGHTPVAATPRDLPVPAEPVKKPTVTLVTRHDDAVLNWKATLSNLTHRCGGNERLARDLLAGNPQAAELEKRAMRIACEREARRRGVVSVSPEQAGV